MTVSREVEAEIARLYHADHWKIGTMAAQLGVHEDVVRRVIGRLPKRPPLRTAMHVAVAVAPYVDFVRLRGREIGKRAALGLIDPHFERGSDLGRKVLTAAPACRAPTRATPSA